jgi:NAD+--dinitrogen-reductase ADP-D-ribosyltransferase
MRINVQINNSTVENERSAVNQAANRERADEFGDYLLSAQVPLSKVFCNTRLLPGMLQGEDEYTVIGGLYEVSIAAY